MSNHSNIIDDGARLQIVPNTRKIVVPSTHKVIGTVGDHNSEQLTFQCPKTIDGHDIANCTDKYISWENAGGVKSDYKITDVITDGENILFAWVIDKYVTSASGGVKISVHFEDKDSNGELLYHWGTTTNTDCQILVTNNYRGDPVIVPKESSNLTASIKDNVLYLT